MLKRRALGGTLALAALLLAAGLAPRHAQAAALTALSTSLGLGAALLSLASVGHGLPPAGLALVGVLLLATLAWGPRWRRVVEARRSSERAVLAMARERFVALQSAWDRGDVEALRRFTTDGMLDELLDQLPARGIGPNRTDVLSLEARLLGIDRLGALELACVEFSGLVREAPDRGAAPFREIWMLTRRPGEPDWRLARQQALL